MVLSDLTMFPFRKRLIFQVDEAMPDPEELKFRFRRRVLLLTLLGALCLLGFPVLRELRPYFSAKLTARRFAQVLLDSRLMAIQNRKPIVLEMDPQDAHRWIRTVHESDDHCEAAPRLPAENISTDDVHWELRYQNADSEEVRSTNKLCFHPTLGLVINGSPLNQGRLLVSGFPENAENPQKRSAKLLLSSAGDEIDYLSE